MRWSPLGDACQVRLVVKSEGTELAYVETDTEDDFMYFRESVFTALEGKNLGSRFPVFQGKFFSDWEPGEVGALEAELSAMHADMRRLPPKPPDGNWASKLAMSGREPGTLAEVYIDKAGAPLLEGLLALARIARKKGLGINWT
jgi:hypothetical protein